MHVFVVCVRLSTDRLQVYIFVSFLQKNISYLHMQNIIESKLNRIVL